MTHGGLQQGIVYDAVRIRLIEIGEAVKGIDPALLDTEPTVPWRAIARMRDHLAYRYFDTDPLWSPTWSTTSSSHWPPLFAL